MNKKASLYYLFGIGLVIALAMFCLVKTVDSTEKLSLFDGGVMQFSYTNTPGKAPLRIGYDDFVGLEPRYVCGYDGSTVRVTPSNKASRYDCWVVSFTYKGQTFAAKDSQEIKLNDYLSVMPRITAKLTYSEEEQGYYYQDATDWNVVYDFTLKEFPLTSTITLSNYYVGLNSQTDALITITNGLSTFPATHAGIAVRPTHSLLERAEDWGQYSFDMKQGMSSYLFPLSTAEMGKTGVEAQVYVTINADKDVILYQQQPATIQYEVVEDVPELEQPVSSDKQGWVARLWSWISNLWGGSDE